jgi:flagellar M-ring protein FliF
VNRVNYQRALQGELARSIEELAPVERARVQLALPERRFAAGRGRNASASVVVKLAGGAVLEPEQARGIVHLVASSVEGLDASRVTLVDDRGQLLSNQGETGAAAATSGAMAHQTKLEAELAKRIESILEPTIGAGRVVARVRAELDWTERESNEEKFDPDSQVARSEELNKEESSEDLTPSGVPGTASETPERAGGAGSGGGTRSTRSTETTNYEISKVVNRVTTAPGSIERLDVAVLVDGQPSEDGSFVAWDAESLTQFEELAKRAIGFTDERGDKIVVTSAAFRPIALEEPAGWLTPELWILISNTLRVLGVLAALFLFARLVVKPIAEKLPVPSAAPQTPIRAEDLANQLAQGGDTAQGIEALLAGNAARGQNVAALAAASSDDAWRALRTWLSER